MAEGFVRKRTRQHKDGTLATYYEVVIDRGIDQQTGKRWRESKSFDKFKEATSYKGKRLAEIDKGVAVDPSKLTLGEFMLTWLETTSADKTNDKTHYDYSRTIKLHILPHLGGVPLQKLTGQMLLAFYRDRKAAGKGDRTIQLCHLRISQVLDEAVRQELVTKNVADTIDAPRVEPKEMKVWTVEEAQKFLAVCGDSCYAPLWHVYVLAGLRRGEGLGLRWVDFDPEEQTLSVRQSIGKVGTQIRAGKPKTEKSRRTVQIGAELCERIGVHRLIQQAWREEHSSYWQENGLIFASEVGTPINPDNLKREFLKLVAKAGVPRIRIHDMRHTHVSHLLSSGGVLKDVSARVGHSRASTTLNIYAHTSNKDQKILAGLVDQLYAGKDKE